METIRKLIWIIRHGESEANAGGRTSDPSAIPLTQRGREQAEAVAVTFSVPPSLVVSSRYLRAKQTAQPVLDHFKQIPHEEWDVHEFTYLSSDRCPNTTILERRPLVEAYWQKCDPNYCDGARAESFKDFIQRVDGTIRRLRKQKGSFCAVFSHMQFIAAVLWRLENLSQSIDSKGMKDYKSFLDQNPISNGAVTEFLLDNMGIKRSAAKQPQTVAPSSKF